MKKIPVKKNKIMSLLPFKTPTVIPPEIQDIIVNDDEMTPRHCQYRGERMGGCHHKPSCYGTFRVKYCRTHTMRHINQYRSMCRRQLQAIDDLACLKKEEEIEMTKDIVRISPNVVQHQEEQNTTIGQLQQLPAIENHESFGLTSPRFLLQDASHSNAVIEQIEELPFDGDVGGDVGGVIQKRGHEDISSTVQGKEEEGKEDQASVLDELD